MSSEISVGTQEQRSVAACSTLQMRLPATRAYDASSSHAQAAAPPADQFVGCIGQLAVS